MNETLWQRLFVGVRRLRQRADWPDYVGPDWADRIMDVAVTDRFHAKQGRSTGRWIVEKAGKQLAVYLKRHYRLSWLHGLLAVMRPRVSWSPALQEWQHLTWARKEGFAVPEVVAACEYIGPMARLQSVLAIEELSGMLPLHEAIPLAAQRLAPGAFLQWKRGLVIDLARLARALHGRRRFHKDFYLCHFYIPDVDTRCLPNWHGRVHLIDLHRLGHHRWSWPFWQMKDLAQLAYSSDVAGVNVRDRVRFWRHYLLTRRRSLYAGWLRRCVGIQWWTYRRHHAKRQRRRAQSDGRQGRRAA
jgi:Lipopolysaccharide kinase (Kdo/WaaP) family